MRLVVLGLVVVLAAAACGGPREIVTAPPVPATTPADLAPAAARARLTVELEPGRTPLPDDVARLRFRVDEVWLKPAGGAWTVYPAGVQVVVDGARRRKALLVAAVPPVAYDSLALRLADVYVEFDANAGAPLTLPRDLPLRLGRAFHPAVGATTTLGLVFEPGASLARTPAGRWLFAPFFTARPPE